MKNITISTKRPYAVLIENGALEHIADYVKTRFSPPRRICVVTDSKVSPIYAEKIMSSLNSNGYSAYRINFPAGEHSKTPTTYINILESLAERGITRTDALLALGGGVVGDITGFVAGTYMRGIEYIYVPTTLLAAIDSSIGGKTGVNLLSGKNLAGLIWQPSLVVTDPTIIETLSEDSLKDGLAEALKDAVVSDGGLVSHILDRNYEYIIDRCISIKKSLVEVDEMDTGIRQLLNFGHTLGHGIEKLSSYSVSHGQAVVKGMIGEARAAYLMGYSSTDISQELIRIAEELDFDSTLDYDPDKLYEQALMDKKIQDGKINMIIPDVIGRASLRKLTLDELKDFIAKAVSQ